MPGSSTKPATARLTIHIIATRWGVDCARPQHQVALAGNFRASNFGTESDHLGAVALTDAIKALLANHQRAGT